MINLLVNTITEVAETISNLGITVVCSSVLLIFCVSMFKSQQKTFEEIKDSLLSTVNRQKEHPSEEDSEMLDLVNTRIHNELSVLLHSLSCDRTYVYLYHNGGVSSSGLFFQRMSCISETVAPGILPVSGISQSLHRSSYSSVLDKIQETGEWFSRDVQEIKYTDDFTYQRFKSTHTESVYLYGLKNSQGRVIGFVGADYCSVNYDENPDEVRLLLKKSSTALSTLVDIRGEVGGSC